MTMLDRMRRHRNWLKWSLALVCLAFVIFYIPEFIDTDAELHVPDTIAVVDGREISSEEFRRMYQAQVQAYRAAAGENVNEQLLRQLGVDRQILQQMVDDRAALVEAERLGLKVTDEEVAQEIYAIPAFQQNGVFIGAERYQQVLASQPVPVSTAEFEESVRRSIMTAKLRRSVTEWLSISDKELEQEYRRRNDKIKLAVIALSGDDYRANVTVTDADVSAYFSAHANDFKIPEKRKVRYFLIDVEALRAKIAVTQQDLERAYNDQVAQFSTPEQIRASHILLRTEGKDDAAVKARAEEVLKQAKAGSAFAELAQKYSEDGSTAPMGGDLDFFPRGRMVPEFDQAAFAMEAGAISDLVKTQFGYHIIKVTEKRPGTTRSLDEMKAQLTEQITNERAQTQASDLATRLEPRIKKPADLDTVAKAEGLTVQETGFFTRDEPILGVGSAPEMTARAFTMNQTDVSGVLRSGRGYVFETLVAKQDAYVPKLDEVKDQARDALIRQRARELAGVKAAEIAGKLKGAPDFDRAAKAASVEPKVTELVTRDASIPELGPATPVVLDAAFKLPQGAVSDPIATDNGPVIIKVLEKQETPATDLVAKKDAFREELLADRRARFFSAYMVKAKQKMKIQVNADAMQRVIG